MKNLYISMLRPSPVGSMRLRFLRSVMAASSLLVCMLLFSSAMAQVPVPSSGLNNNSNVQSTNPDRVVGNPYIYQISDSGERIANPDLPPGISCPNLKVIFVLDESGSIDESNYPSQVRNGALALANALLGTEAQLRVIEFATGSSVIDLGGTTVNNGFISNFRKYLRLDSPQHFNSQSYDPGSQSSCAQYTNWQTALKKVAAQPGDLVIFFTDGNPTAYDVTPTSGSCYTGSNVGSICDGLSGSGETRRYGTASNVVNKSLNHAICAADIVKGSGKHMFVVGVGANINVANMIAISDGDNFATNPDIFTADYSIGSFADLAANLAAAVNVICGTTLSITKTASSGPFCLNEFVTFTITVTNTGGVSGYSANNTVMTDVFPAGFNSLQFNGAAPSGAIISGNTLTYNIGTLNNGESKTVQVKAKIISANNLLNTGYAVAYNANQVSASATPQLETVPPIINCPATSTRILTASCGVDITPSKTGNPTGSDNCGQTPVFTYSDAQVPGCGSTKTITRTWTATDWAGNTSTCQQTIHVVDNTNPSITAPANQTVTCASQVPAVNVNSVTKSDNCPGTVVTHVSDVIEDSLCVNRFKIKRKYRATDACGNFVEATQTITVYDGVNPTITAPATISVNCQNPIPAPNIAGVTASDNCGGIVNVTHESDTPSGSGCSYVITRKFRATDACGNFAFANQTINVTDNTNPTASNPADIVLTGCNGSFPTPNIEVVTDEADNCGTPTVTFHSDGNPTTNGCIQTKVRKYKVADACGNSIFVYQNLIRTVDTQNPTASNPADIVLTGCNGSYPAPNTEVVTDEADNCGTPNVTFHSDGAPTLNGCIETVVRKYKVQDACENFIYVYQNLKRTVDTQNPTASNPADIVLTGCNGSFPAPNTEVVTDEADNCGTPTVTFHSDGAPTLNGCIETVVRKYKVQDACENFIYVYQNLKRTVDTQNPTASNPADIVLTGCNGSYPAPNTEVVTDEADNCGTPTVTFHSDGAPTLNGCIETVVRKYKVQDACENFIYVYQNLKRTVDTQNPTASNPADIVLTGCNGSFPAANTEVVTDEADNCGTPTVTFHSDGAPTLNGCIETVVRKYKVQDACENFIYVYQNLKRTVDTQNPTASNPADIVLTGCNGSFPTPNIEVVTDEADNCGTPTVTFHSDGAPTLNGCIETVVRKYKVQDACENFIYVYQNLKRTVDTTDPTIDAPADYTLPICNQAWPETLNTQWSDNCSQGGPVIGYGGDVTTNGCTQTRTYTFYIVDACGNDATATTTITRTYDVTDPTIDAPADYTLPICNQAWPETLNTQWSDNCSPGGPVIGYGGDVTTNGCTQTRTYTFYIVDACGNDATATTTITRTYDVTDPTIYAPADYTLPICNQAWPETLNTQWSDNCSSGGPVMAYGGDVTTNGCTQTRTYTFYIVDACGNDATATTTITRTYDITDPTIDAPADYTLPICNQAWPETLNTQWSDNCSQGGSVIGYGGDVTTNGCTQTRTYTFYIVDACGNDATATTTITRTYDVTDPTINAPADYVLEGCNPAWPALVNATWSDNCSQGGPLQGSAGDITTDGCSQSRTYTFYVMDACGNDATAYTTITRFFNEAAPVIIPVADYTLPGCNQDWPTLVTQWTSDCSGGGNVTADADDVVVTNGCIQTRTYTFTVNDDCGLPATSTTVVTRTYDVTDPTIYAPADYTLPICNQAWPETLNTQWSDNCSQGGPVIGYGGDVTTNGCTQTRTYTFYIVDACGNDATATTTITRTYDVTDPTIYAPADYTLPICNQAWPETLNTQWSDNCSQGGSVIGYGGDVTTNGCTQTRTYTFYIVDACGNDATATTTITRTYDVTDPTIYAPADYTLPICNQAWPETLNTQWSDNCSQGGSVFGYGGDVTTNGCTQTRTYTFYIVDACGNDATATTTITRTYDVTDPTIYAPADYTLPVCNQAWPETLNTQWSDNCSQGGSVFGYGGDVTTNGCTQTRTYTFYIVDACGNDATATTTISRTYDVTDPTINAPADYVLEGCNPAWPALVAATWSDNCSQGGPLQGSAGDITTDGCSQSRTYTFYVMDACGNDATAYTTITRLFSEANPEITPVANYTLPGCNADWPTLVTQWTSNCSQGGNVTGVMGTVMTDGCIQTRQYTFTVLDGCGLSATTTTTVTRIYDVTGPVFTYVPVVTAECDDVIDFGTPIAEDNCSGTNVTFTHVDSQINNGEDCGQYTTYSQGGWGSPNNSGPGSYRTANFAGAFPSGLTVGCATGSYTFTSGNAIRDFLPAGGPSSVLAPGNVVNPTSVSNQLASQLVAAELNVGFDAYDPNFGDATGFIGNLVFGSGTFQGMTVSSVMQIANDVLGGCSNAYTPTALASAMEDINLSFHEGTTNSGDLLCLNTSNQCSYTVTRTWTATDACGNSTSVDQVVTVSDTENPTIDAPANYTLPVCNQAWPEIVTAPWSDNCADGGIVTAIPSDVVTEGCTQTRAYVFSITDNCDNMANAITYITRTYDVTDPTIYAPADYTLPVCNQAWPETLNTQWSDNCSQGGSVIGYGGDVTTNGCTQTRTYTFYIVDACGNDATATTTITRTYDVTAPTLVTPIADKFVECEGEVSYEVPVFTDNCGLQSIVMTVPSDTTFLPHGYIIHVEFVATDACGNSSEDNYDIFVIDNTVPILINIPADIFAQCGEIPEPAIVLGMDNCEQELDVEFDEDITQDGCYVHIERTWTVTDADGNVTSHTQIIEFNDDVAPVIVTSPADITVECGDDIPYEVPTFSDNCDDELEILPASSITPITCGNVIHRSWKAIDDCGNEITAHQTITIVDTQAPVLYGVPSNVEAECGQLPAVPVVTAYDACDGVLDVIFSEDGEQDGCYYNLVRTWTATDACGHITTQSQTIVVGDNTDPYIISSPATVIQINCDEDAPVLEVEFGDNCDEDLTYHVFSNAVATYECGYDIQRTYRATDDCGNSVEFVQIVQIRDTTDPFATYVPANLTIQCTDPIPAVVDAEFDDNCDTELTIEYNTHNEDLDCGYRIVRTWTATDDCDNSYSVSQYIVVTDNVPPVFDPYIIHATVECDEVEDFLGVTATDLCSDVTITYTDMMYSGNCLGNLVRTYTATDDCGNTATAQQIIAIVDTHGPVIENPASVTVQCDEAPTAMPEVSIYDACTSVISSSATQDIIPVDDCSYQIVWHWTATDSCGNVSEATTIITVIDSEAPEFHNVPEGQTYSCEEDFADPVAPTASDNCSLVTIVPSEVMVPGLCPNSYDIVYTWTAYDACGNDNSVSITYHIVDTTAPTLSSLPENVTVECDAIPAAPVVTAYDICDGIVDVDFDELISGTCQYTITRIWTATDECGNTVSHTQLIYVQDTVDPVFTTEVENITVQCADDVPAPISVMATDNCGLATVTPYVETLESDDCGNAYIRVYYIAEDACGNTSMIEYFITVMDTTDPELDGCPSNIVLGCYDEVPAPANVTAFDNCQGELTVNFDQYYFGDEPTEGSIADCRLITPIRPANNPCGYPVDWAMVLFGLPNAHRYYHVENGNLVRFPDGTIHITAEMHNAYNNANGWNVDVWFANEKDWNAFSNQSFPTNFKADCGGLAANHQDWLYFVLQAGAGAELIGFGGYAGSSLNLIHAPLSKYFQFQLGDGANNYNAADNAFGGWFSYAGLFLVNNVPYGSTGNISGAGDFAFEMECCPNYYIIRQWTATDCSGNTTSCSQTITFDSSEDGGGDMVTVPAGEVTDSGLFVNVSPNPANSNTLFTFKTKENAQTTLEVFDAVGKKVADVFMGKVEAGIEYKVNYNVDALSTGVYLYRLQNGNSTEVGKLVIGK